MTGVRYPTGAGIFLLATASRPALGPTQPRIICILGAFSSEVKRPGCEADHPPPSSAEVKNAWHYTSTPTYVLMAWCLIKSTGTALSLTLPYSSAACRQVKFLLHSFLSERCFLLLRMHPGCPSSGPRIKAGHCGNPLFDAVIVSSFPLPPAYSMGPCHAYTIVLKRQFFCAFD
jgi:hypothetical protein